MPIKRHHETDLLRFDLQQSKKENDLLAYLSLKILDS